MKKIRNFNEGEYNKVVENYKNTLKSLKKVRTILENENIGITPNDLNILFKSGFTDEAVKEAGLKRYKNEADSLKQEVYKDEFFNRIAFKMELFREEYTINTEIPFEFTNEGIKEPLEWLKQQKENLTTYFSDEGYEIWQKQQKLAEEVNEIYQRFKEIHKDIKTNVYVFGLNKMLTERNGKIEAVKPLLYP